MAVDKLPDDNRHDDDDEDRNRNRSNALDGPKEKLNLEHRAWLCVGIQWPILGLLRADLVNQPDRPLLPLVGPMSIREGFAEWLQVRLHVRDTCFL